LDKPTFTVKIVENVTDYIELLEKEFDFEAIHKLFLRPDFKFLFDGMSGSSGPYAKILFG
jgi:phosphoglucomutase